MDEGKSPPATRADTRRLDAKIDSSTARLEKKTDALQGDIRRLDEKTDALQGDIRRLDEKIDSSTARLAKEIVATQADVRGIKETMATKNDVKRILAAVESFAGKAQVYDRAAVLHGHALTETAVTLRDHEKRLRVIEAHSL